MLYCLTDGENSRDIPLVFFSFFAFAIRMFQKLPQDNANRALPEKNSEPWFGQNFNILLMILRFYKKRIIEKTAVQKESPGVTKEELISTSIRLYLMLGRDSLTLSDWSLIYYDSSTRGVIETLT